MTTEKPNSGGLKPGRGNLDPKSPPAAASRTQSLKRKGDGSLSDEQLLKRKRAGLRYEPLDTSGVLLGKQPRQIAFVARESDKNDILLNKFDPDSVNWYVPSKAKANKNATMGVTACDRESLEAFRKTMELMAMEAEDSHGCVYFRWNVEFITPAEHEEQKNALHLVSQTQATQPCLHKAESTTTLQEPSLPQAKVISPTAEPTVSEIKPAPSQTKPPLAPTKPDKPEANRPIPQPGVNLPQTKPIVTPVIPAATSPKPALPQPKVDLPKTEPTIPQAKPTSSKTESTLPGVATQAGLFTSQTQPLTSQPTSVVPEEKPGQQFVMKKSLPQAQPALAEARPTPQLQEKPSLSLVDPIALPKKAAESSAMVNKEFNINQHGLSPYDVGYGNITPLWILTRDRDGPCVNCEDTDHTVATCPMPGEEAYGAIGDCPVHNARSHSFDDCTQTLARIGPSESTRKLVLKDVPYFFHYLIKNRVNKPPIMSKLVCWLTLALHFEDKVSEAGGLPWTKEFTELVRDCKDASQLAAFQGKVHWDDWDPQKHRDQDLPVDPALKDKTIGDLRKARYNRELKLQWIEEY